MTDEEQQFVDSLPSIEKDENSWQKCASCAQGERKNVAYRECGSCKHFSIHALAAIMDISERIKVDPEGPKFEEYLEEWWKGRYLFMDIEVIDYRGIDC